MFQHEDPLPPLVSNMENTSTIPASLTSVTPLPGFHPPTVQSEQWVFMQVTWEGGWDSDSKLSASGKTRPFAPTVRADFS